MIIFSHKEKKWLALVGDHWLTVGQVYQVDTVSSIDARSVHLVDGLGAVVTWALVHMIK